MRRVLGTAAATAGLAVLLLSLTTWPLLPRMTTEGFGLPGMEAVDHLWALWAGLRDGPLVIDTDLLDYPAGYRWVLADPLNLLWFGPGYALGGPALGWNAVAWGGLLVSALAAALWADRQREAAAVAAVASLGLATLAGSLFTGMSEVLTLGWLVVALAALHRLRAETPWLHVLGVGILAGLTAWGGPYTSLYAVFAAPPIVVGRLWQAGRAQGGAVLARLLGAGLTALLVAAPVGWALAVARPRGLPGSDSSLPMVLAAPGDPKNLMLGAEPLALLWPLPGVEPKHSVFLGSLLAALALVGVLRHGRAALAPAAAAGILCLLGLGFVLQSGSELVTWRGQPLGLPALWLSMAIEPLGRAARWHRAVIPASLILAGLAGQGAVAIADRLRLTGPRRGLVLGFLAAAMFAEGVWRAPLDWPRPTFPVAAPAGYALLGEGPILPLPLTRFSSGDPTQLRSPALLWQTGHGQPLGGNPRQPGPGFRDPAVSALAQRILEGDTAAATALQALGFCWIIVQHEHDVRRVSAALGEPNLIEEGVWGWSLSAPDPQGEDGGCGGGLQ